MDLTVEYARDPIGLDRKPLRLGWRISSDRPGVMQAAFQVRVASGREVLLRDGADVWDSGRREEGESAFRLPDLGLLSGGRYCWQVRIWDGSGGPGPWSEIAQWSMGLLDATDWRANWVTPCQQAYAHRGGNNLRERHATHWLRRDVVLREVPPRVALAVVCLGYYEVTINGCRVGEEPLAPSLTVLDRRAMCITHEIGGLLKPGTNRIGVWCSPGWYLPHRYAVHEGRTPLLRLQAYAREGDGELTVVFATDDTWRCRLSNRTIIGPWRGNGFGGEEVDALGALPEWHSLDCSGREWQAVRAVSPPPVVISARACPSNRIGKRLAAQAVRRLPDDRFEVDFGTCLTGWVTVRFPRLAAGQEVVLRFFDLPADEERRRDHSYGQRSVYRARGAGTERFENKFNYAGFRYLVLEGLTDPPALADMQALLIETAIEPAGEFRCSNPLFNRIHELNRWTLRCLNLGAYSVDCPHRERQGYGADAQTALPAYLYLTQAAGFLRKWLVDWCDLADPETGRIPHCAPTRHRHESPGWGGVVVPLAWSLWVGYADREALDIAFPVIERYIRRLLSGVADGVLRARAFDWKFHGDWVAPGRGMDSGQMPDDAMKEAFNTAYLVYLIRIFAKIAAVLDRSESAAVVEATATIPNLICGLRDTFFDDQADCYAVPEQAYQAMPLLAGAVPPDLEPRVRERLVRMIAVESDGHLGTGMLGTTFLMEYLQQIGRDDLIAGMLAKETYPGWGYMLAKGATTIWEQWNGFWSQIHSCFAGPAAWFYSGLAGIRLDEARPGGRSFILKPTFLPDLAWVEAIFEAPTGRVVSAWRRSGDRIHWTVRLPPNTQATAIVPRSDRRRVVLNGDPIGGEDWVTIAYSSPPGRATRESTAEGL